MLREHIKLHNMEELFGEVMVPTEEVVDPWRPARRKKRTQILPGLRFGPDGHERRKLAPRAARAACVMGFYRRYVRPSGADQRQRSRCDREPPAGWR